MSRHFWARFFPPVPINWSRSPNYILLEMSWIKAMLYNARMKAKKNRYRYWIRWAENSPWFIYNKAGLISGNFLRAGIGLPPLLWSQLYHQNILLVQGGRFHTPCKSAHHSIPIFLHPSARECIAKCNKEPWKMQKRHYQFRYACPQGEIVDLYVIINSIFFFLRRMESGENRGKTTVQNLLQISENDAVEVRALSSIVCRRTRNRLFPPGNVDSLQSAFEKVSGTLGG